MKPIFEWKGKGRSTLLVLIVISSIAHLFFISIYPISYDLRIWTTVGKALASGKNFYCEALASDTVFGYPPLFAQAIIFPLSLLINPSDEFAFLFALRLVFLAFDLGTGILLWEMLGSKRLLSALWFLNPFVMGVAQYQFDSIPAFFILLSVYALGKSVVKSSWLLGIAASLKTYPALLLPVAIGRAKGLRGIAAALLAALSIPILSTLPFLRSECFWTLATVHFNVGSQLMRRYAFPIAYAVLLLLAYKRGIDIVSAGISMLSSFHLFYTFSVYPFPPVQYAASLLPLLVLDIPRPGQRLAKCLAYNSVWISALAARYKATLYRHIPMPIPPEPFGQLSFYAFMASLAATCAVALLGSPAPSAEPRFASAPSDGGAPIPCGGSNAFYNAADPP
jgi:hypothetical protein